MRLLAYGAGTSLTGPARAVYTINIQINRIDLTVYTL